MIRTFVTAVVIFAIALAFLFVGQLASDNNKNGLADPNEPNISEKIEDNIITY